ncbi:hypothetical protein ABVR20_001823 [Escherichia coli]
MLIYSNDFVQFGDRLVQILNRSGCTISALCQASAHSASDSQHRASYRAHRAKAS